MHMGYNSTREDSVMIRDYRYPSRAVLVLLQALQTPDPVQQPPGTYAALTPAVPVYSPALPTTPVIAKPAGTGFKSALRKSSSFTPVVIDYNIEEITGAFTQPSLAFTINLENTSLSARKGPLVRYVMTDTSSAAKTLGFAVLHDGGDHDNCIVYELAADTYAHANALLMRIYNEHVTERISDWFGEKCIVLPNNSTVDYTKLLNGQWETDTNGMRNCAKAALPEKHKKEDWADQTQASHKKQVKINSAVKISDV